jgi:hypothetical protein
MRPEREFLFEQAAASRQLALISVEEVAERLKALAAEYETLALVDTSLVGGEGCQSSSQEPTKPLTN